MGNNIANSNTHIANATGKPLRVYYSVDRLRLEEMVVEVSVGGEGSPSGEVTGSASVGTQLVFKLDTRIRYIRIPPGGFTKIAGEGAIYVSVFVEKCDCSDHCEKTISLNFHIPRDRSFIVTKRHELKFQKYGESIWIDEQGTRHSP